jgi:hypothetical protein
MQSIENMFLFSFVFQTNCVLKCLISNTNGSQNILTNIKAIIEEFCKTSDGIVKSKETQTEKWQKK